MCAVLVSWLGSAFRGGSCSLQHLDLLGMLLSSDIDAVIGQHHEEKWDVEGHHGAGDGVGLVDHEDTCIVRVVVEFPFPYLRVGGREKMRVGR